jgi:twitching motility protein PilT
MITIKMNIEEILQIAVSENASDVHIRAGNHPVMRIKDELVPQVTLPVLDHDDTMRLFKEVTDSSQQEIFDKNLELDFAYSIPTLSRFRVNAAIQRGSVTLTFRVVRTSIPTMEQLGLPDLCKEISLKRDGLIIITGPTGCGKSTTLAAMMEYVNENARRNVITIEDPIEYLHSDKKCMFSQREIGSDTHSFSNALKHALRQDPDVILVGEMRDLETMGIALSAAETGHLVMTTLHTPSASQAIDRFVDVFPPYQQQQVRIQLSSTIVSVIYQRLILRADGKGLVPAIEIMVGSPAVKNLIREGKTYQIPNVMQSGGSMGMCTIDQALMALMRNGTITRESYRSYANSFE